MKTLITAAMLTLTTTAAMSEEVVVCYDDAIMLEYKMIFSDDYSTVLNKSLSNIHKITNTTTKPGKPGVYWTDRSILGVKQLNHYNPKTGIHSAKVLFAKTKFVCGEEVF